MSEQEMQKELADAVAATIWAGEAQQSSGGEWIIEGLGPALPSDGVILTNSDGSRREAPRAFGAATFEEALKAAVAGGISVLGDPLERYEELLRAWKIARF